MKYYILRSKWNPFRKRGITLNITPSFKCNYHCEYCFVDIDHKKPSDGKNLTADGWLEYIDTFPVKIAEITINGGEPTLWGEFVYLTTEILKRGYFVMIHTNLSKPEILIQLPKTNHLVLNPTFHHGQTSPNVFIDAYNMLKDKQKMYVDEIDNKILSISRKKPFGTTKYAKERKCLRARPDGTLYTDCYSLLKALGKQW